MQPLLVITDFSGAARHALDFAANLIAGSARPIELVHVYTLPVTYTVEGIVLAGLALDLEPVTRALEAELDRARRAWPELQIRGRMITGSFLEALRDEAQAVAPQFIVLGTSGFTNLYPGDTDPLDALKMLRAPVLLVPESAPIRPIRKLVYACNYRYAGPARTPVEAIKEWVSEIGAGLSVLHTDKAQQGTDPEQAAGERWLRTALEPLQPAYHWVVDPDFLHGLRTFLSTHPVDCVLAVPRRYGFWESLFHQSRTKALARMNKLPILAIPELS